MPSRRKLKFPIVSVVENNEQRRRVQFNLGRAQISILETTDPHGLLIDVICNKVNEPAMLGQLLPEDSSEEKFWEGLRMFCEEFCGCFHLNN